MSIINFVSDILKPISSIVDNLHTSDEERLSLKNKLTRINNELTSKMITYEAKLLVSRTSIITAEASGQSWMQRNWRPITMLTFLGLVCCDSFGLLKFRLADQAWSLLQIGLGGYVIGRSAEKIVPIMKRKL